MRAFPIELVTFFSASSRGGVALYLRCSADVVDWRRRAVTPPAIRLVRTGSPPLCCRVTSVLSPIRRIRALLRLASPRRLYSSCAGLTCSQKLALNH